MAGTDDTDEVLSAIRLGWFVAEVRGRNRVNGPKPNDSSGLPDRHDHQLPLRNERSAEELRIAAQEALIGLAIDLKVDDAQGTAAKKIDALAKILDSAGEAAKPACWNALADALYKFDAHVQDFLTTESETQSCGYQLGRGLAEAYWALEIAPPNPDNGQLRSESWDFLLGSERCQELTRLAGRLTAYFPPYAAAAVAGSLSAWRRIVSNPTWRDAPDAKDALYKQTRRWYEILILRQDPSSLVKPYAILRNYRAVIEGVKAFLPQLLIGIGSLAALSWLIDLLNTSNNNAVGKSVLGIISALGLSSTGISTRLKNTSQSLTKRLKQDAFSDLVAIYTTEAPRLPGPLTKLPGAQERKSYRAVSRAVQSRMLTPVTDHAV